MEAVDRQERPRRRRKEAPPKGVLREQAILDAAEALLDREGVESMTVEQIAQGAGITRGALYFYFGSKQEVLTALVARTVQVIAEDARAAAQDLDVDPIRAIERAAERTEHHWREHGVVMRAAVEYMPFIAEVAALWRGTVETYIEEMTKVLIRAGLPSRGGATSARSLATALCWSTERSFYIAAIGDGDLRAARRRSLELWKRAIAGAG
jgi:TetR/AcrR family transcriptional regulator, ethionamide resistance regulator